MAILIRLMKASHKSIHDTHKILWIKFIVLPGNYWETGNAKRFFKC